MVDDLKRKEDFERLARIETNTESIKQMLEKYPLPAIDERMNNQGKRLQDHIDNHKWWITTVAAIVGMLLAITKFLEK